MLRIPRSATPSLLSIDDLGVDGVRGVLESAAALKRGSGTGTAAPLLRGRAVALLFEQPSLRTRVSFEVGLARLGATTVTVTGADVGLGTREPIADMARSLARYVDAIVARIHSHAALEELAAASGIPVVNALTEREHPCQALADMLTLQEHLGQLERRQLVFLGDGNNVAHSLLLAGAAVGMHVRVVTPRSYGPDPGIVDLARATGRETGARIEVGHDPATAVEGADAVYTDVWASMGSEHEAELRRWAFRPYRVTATLLRRAPGALVMHCLPAHRGEEIEAAVVDGPRSVCFDQAENRLYVQQAALVRLMAQPLRSVQHGEPAPITVALAGRLGP